MATGSGLRAGADDLVAVDGPARVDSIFIAPMLAVRDVVATLRAVAVEAPLRGATSMGREGSGPLSARDLDCPLSIGGECGGGLSGSGTVIVIKVSTRRDLITFSKVR